MERPHSKHAPPSPQSVYLARLRCCFGLTTTRKWAAVCAIFALSVAITLLGELLPRPLVALQPDSPLAEVSIVTETVVGNEGFFRVGRSTKGRWWMIDPNGKPFFYRGVTSVGDGRGIWPSTSPLSSYTQVITKKYSQDSARFRDVTFEQLRRWNFNALGTWTASDLWEQGMPYTIVLDFLKVGPEIRLKGIVKLPDVFDPEWNKAIDAKAREVVLSRHDSSQLVGYFTDNELGWADAESPDRQVNPDLLLTDEAKPSLLQTCLSLEEERSAYAAAWDFVLQRHSSNLKQLAKDWQVEIDSRAKIKQWTQAKQAIVSRGYLEDQRVFQAEFARRYFELSAAAIRRYDQNHLLLGSRFGAPPSAAVFSAVKRPWVDVVSANNYRYEFYERMDIYYRATHLPILNTEFSWGHKVFSEKPLPEEPEGGFPSTERMIRNGEQALVRALTHPGLVGYTWYRWLNRPDHVPPISVGLVTLEDEPNRWHTDLLASLNAKAEVIASTDFGYTNSDSEQ